jgi:hypothetical protein
MKTQFKWALLFGIITAAINFFISFFMSLVCGVFISPIAAGLATYVSSKEDPENNHTHYRVKVGLIVGSIGAFGGILGTMASLLLLSLAIFTFNSQDMPSLEELISIISSGNLLFGVVTTILTAAVIIGLCVATAAITGKVLSNKQSSSQNMV